MTKKWETPSLAEPAGHSRTIAQNMAGSCVLAQSEPEVSQTSATDPETEKGLNGSELRHEDVPVLHCSSS